MFTKKQKTKDKILSLVAPKESQNTKASTCKYVEPNRPIEPHFRNVKSLPLMCLKYNIGSLMTHSNDATYHRLAKVLKFSTTKMHDTQDNQEDF